MSRSRSCKKCGARIPAGRYTCPKCRAKQPSMSASKYNQNLTKPGIKLTQIDLKGDDESLRLDITKSIRAFEMYERQTAWENWT